MSRNAKTEYKTLHDLLESVLCPKMISGELRASLTPPSTKGMVIEPISNKITYLGKLQIFKYELKIKIIMFHSLLM